MSPRRAPRDLVLATGNPGKRAELAAILASRPGGGALRLGDLAELPGFAFPEEGHDYEENAVAKARAVARAAGRAALADDSGLEVEALGGAPGPGSARYGGPGLDDAGRRRHLLEALRGTAPAARGARFVCVVAFAAADGELHVARGECAGRILEAPRGAGGFGYDPIFEVEVAGERLSMAELPPARKNQLSHRARALHALCDQLGL